MEGIDTIKQALKAFSLPPARVEPVAGGLIHRSYLIILGPPERERRYVLQGLHEALSNVSVLADHASVSHHLQSAGRLAPTPIRTSAGQLSVMIDGIRWRLLNFVPGETIIGRSATVEEAVLAGRELAQFHNVMASFQGRFSSTHPGHNTEYHLNGLRESFESAPEGLRAELERSCTELLDRLPRFIMPETLPRFVVHGDPKLTNFRFQEKRAVLIDLDTCTRHTRLVDLGDALRSWCHEPEVALGHISWTRGEAFLEAYLSHATPLSEEERLWLPRCAVTISLELAARFARDFFEDSYFAYDETRYESRRAHNQVRTKGMLYLAENFEQSAERISAVIA
ncbi:MAG: phosphotransferase [Myxococcota bacterium]|nr:phosphotransferase [Myxococcota bacterium]